MATRSKVQLTAHKNGERKLKKYAIYGVGAALVDTEVAVEDEFLSTAEIKKGVMTLVDQPRQAELLSLLSSDSSNIIRKCGGSVCNSMVAASQLGAKTFFSGKVARDNDGELYADDLMACGVTFQSASPESGVTGKCLVMVSSDAERTMNTFLGVSEDLSMREIDQSALATSQWLYLEGYLVTDQRRAEMAESLVDMARENGVRVAVSLSDPFVVELFGGSLRQIIGSGIDMLFCNIQEALTFTGAASIDGAAAALAKYASTFVITNGDQGALFFDGNNTHTTHGIAVNAIDTNGAGDMFAGAFLYAVTSGRKTQWALDFANYCASRVVQQFGPRLSDADFDEIRRAYDL